MWHDVVVIGAIHCCRQHGLLAVADVVDRIGPAFRLGQRRQQHGREDGDDGDDHQQFNQSEPVHLGRAFFPLQG
jgi:hypothetical protein